MIVKNEEKNIEKALSWGKGIVSEQIVVDTGSTDRTVEIAEGMGARICHFQWIDDFAAAKNFAISQCRYDWIALLDADEYMTQEDARKLLNLIKELHDTECESLLTGWIHLDDRGGALSISSQIRVFRNMPILRYKRRIHEYLEIPGRKLRVANIVEDVSIYHTGYQKEASGRKTGGGRNFKLIQAEIADHPDSYEMYGYLGNEYEAMSMWQEAKEAYKKAVALMPDMMKGQYDMSTSGFYFRLVELLAALPDTDAAELMETYQKAVEGWPEDGDFDYVMGKYFSSHGNYQAAERHMRQALDLLEKYGNALRSSLLSGKIVEAYELLAICCYNNGKLEDCVRLTAALLKQKPYLMSTLVVTLSAYRRDMDARGAGEAGAAQVAGLLGNAFYDFRTLKDRLFVLRAAMGAGYEDLVKVMRGRFTPEELAAVDRSLNGESKGQETGLNGKDEDGAMAGKGADGKKEKCLRVVLFYSSVESFNFFTDQLKEKLQAKGHKVFILDLRKIYDDSNTGFEDFQKFLSEKVDGIICFDGLGIREEKLLNIWDRHGAVAVDILMDPPLRFHFTLEKHPEKYHLFCCDREHVEYVRRYFKKEVPYVSFMPHVGVMPAKDAQAIPYRERKYDILFCGTYYRPEEQMAKLEATFSKDSDAYHLYEKTFENLVKDSSLSVWQGVLLTKEQLGWEIPEDILKNMLWGAESLDWAIRMYQRGRVVSVLGESGMDIHLLGRGWENHPTARMANVHRISDRIPYGETLNYMADARINLNVMPGFKDGTHDRIFNTLLQRSVPLTDSSAWIDENFTDGVDIALYNLKQLERLPDIAKGLLQDEELAGRIMENGYKKTAGKLTWDACAEWILNIIRGNENGGGKG